MSALPNPSSGPRESAPGGAPLGPAAVSSPTGETPRAVGPTRENRSVPGLSIATRPGSEGDTPGDAGEPIAVIDTLSLYYGEKRALKDISMAIGRHRITAFIGPSGCGKSTLLRCLNRMNDLIDDVRISGTVTLGGIDVYGTSTDVTELRKRVGMVFQKSTPFPKSIYDNVAYGPRILGLRRRGDLDQVVERSLRSAALWDEVKDRLHEGALRLSGGQQQRLCIARAIAVEPDVLLMDEPCSALDPIATARIEELMDELKSRYTIVIVTHNMQQAARVSDHTGFLLMGDLVEFAPTPALFTTPRDRRTEDYITGRFG